MELVPEASKYGYFYAFDTEHGERFILLEGLDHNEWHDPAGIEAFMLDHYSIFATLYGLLIITSFSYLISRFILWPLLKERTS